MDYTGSKALVCGMALSGISAAKLLKNKGAEVTLQDIKKEEDIGFGLEEIKAMGIELYLGKNPDDIVEDFDLIVVSPGLPLELGFIQKAVNAGIEVIGEFELGYRFCKSPVAVITGTNGKTTTTALLGNIATAYYPNSAVVGNIGVAFTEKAESIPENSLCVAEVSSFQLETAPSLKPKAAAILNITPDHLDRHKTFENYGAIKASVSKNQDEKDFLILNYEDANCKKIGDSVKSRVLFFSSENILNEGIYIENGFIHLKADAVDENIVALDELKILGKHNHENIMAAALTAFSIGIPLEIIKEEIRNFGGVAHRIEYVDTINNIEFYNDSKGTNTDAAVKSIEAMKRPIVLIGGGYDKNSDFTGWVEKFEGKVKELVLVGQVAAKIAQTCDKVGFKNYTLTKTFEEAVAVACEKAVPGDAVLLSPACASWDMFKSFEERGDLFKSLVSQFKG